MPNGRSGGFVIEKVDLKSLFQTLPAETVVAKIIAPSTNFRPAGVLETVRFIDECPHDRIAVEEQDHKSYVIRLSNEPKLIWLVVGSEAPIFAELRQRHQRWATEHADVNSWIAF